MNFPINLDLHWSSDWNGDEIGYPEVNVVGYILCPVTPIYIFILIWTL